MHILTNLLILLLFTFLPLLVQAQHKKHQFIEEMAEIIAELSEEENVDLNTLLDELYHFADHPINLNYTSKEELKHLHILSDVQINDILSHIEETGKLLTIYELQSITSLNMETIHNLLHFVKVNRDFDAPHISVKEMLKEGSNELLIRNVRTLEEQVGFSPIDDSSYAANPNKRYLGDPNKIMARYRFKFSNNISWGVTGEKDAGEEFFKGTQSRGFDFYSAHLYVKNIGRIKHAALGDYQIQLGQGLTMWSGRSFRKSSDVMNIKRNAGTIKPYTSVDENIYMRGAATTVALGQFEVTGFYSSKYIDANLSSANLLDDEDEQTFTSFQTSGFHRTPSEMEDKDALKETIYGSNIKFAKRNYEFGATAISTMWDGDISKNLSTYNQFDFNDNSNVNLGLYYNYIYHNFNFFGEAATSKNGGIAYLNGAIITLDPKLSVALLLRNYQPNYQSVYSQAISESSKNINEKGTYLALTMKPNKKFTINTYLDRFSFPWLKSSTSAPSTGYEHLTQVTYKPSKKLEIYARYKQEIKQVDKLFETAEYLFSDGNTNWYITTDLDRIEQLTIQNRQSLRLNASYKLSDSWQMKNRLELSEYQIGQKKSEYGYLAFHDITYHALSSPLSFSFRAALFESDSYNARIYAYENEILYYFSIPAYYNRGMRTYLSCRYSITRNIDFWIRIGQWYYNNIDVISSGLNQIEGRTKTELKTQLRIKL